MGRGRKGKKAATVASHDDSGEEEKIPAKRRGRPQKILKDEIFEEEEAEKIDGEEDYVDNSKNSILNKENKTLISPGKRKRNLQVKDSLQDSVKVENGTTDSIKPVGFRQNGSRRKNKPRRAAEVGVECK